jgi:hypothetical protein
MLTAMTNWFRQRRGRSEGIDHRYSSFSDLERGFDTPEEAMLERIQRGVHNGNEPFDDLKWRIGIFTMLVVVLVVVVVVVVCM